MLVTDETSHFDRSEVKLLASSNMLVMAVTDETSHFDRSEVKLLAP